MTKKLRGARKPVKPFQESITLSAQEIITNGQQAAVFLHKGIRGDERAAALADFLRSTIPSRFGVAKGEAIDYQGNQTTQLDIIVYDRQDSAVLFKGKDGNLLIPAESVYAAIECKTTLNQNEFNTAYKAAAKLKKLRPYQSYFKSHASSLKVSAEKFKNLPRCHYSLFAFETNSTSSGEWLKTELTRAQEGSRSEDAKKVNADIGDVDNVLVLDRGIFIPGEAKGKVYPNDTTNAFLDWYLSLMNFLQREAKRRSPGDLQIYSHQYQRGWGPIHPRTPRSE